MANSSKKIDIYKTNTTGTVKVVLTDRATGEKVRRQPSTEPHREVMRRIWVYDELIYSDEDFEKRIFTGGWRTKTTLAAVNTVIAETGGGSDLKIRNRKGVLYVVYCGIEICEFIEGMSIFEMLDLGRRLLARKKISRP